MSWSVLREHLTGAHDARERDDGALVVSGAGADVRVRRLDVEGEAWIEIATRIAGASEVDLLVITFHNIGIPIGNLVVDGDHVLLVQTLPLAWAQPETVTEVTEFFASYAAELRRVVIAPPPAAAWDYFDVT